MKTKQIRTIVAMFLALCVVSTGIAFGNNGGSSGIGTWAFDKAPRL
jgi:hypothetical protein